ncbi:MAG: hypothetical protein ABJ382_15295, partial [Ilumatobacter sp.]
QQPPPGVSPPVAVSGLSRALAEGRRRRSAVAAVVALLFVFGLGGLVLAMTRSDSGSGEPVSTGAVAGDPAESDPPAGAVVGEEPLVPSDAGATSVSPTVVTPPTEPPPTEPPPTVAPAEPVVPPQEELIPGFPVPANAEEFLATLQTDPERVGRRGPDLAREFEKVLGEERGPRRTADRLREDLEKWVENDEIDPAVAEAVVDFLDELAPRDRDDDDDDDGDDD